VIPNGVAIPQRIDPEVFLWKYPSLRGRKIVLFLGRIHFKKGLDILIEAWTTVARRWPDAMLVLAGPDFEETQTRIESLIEQRGLTERVLFTGMLRSEQKWSALQAAECFILPSYSEGLSVSTLEAMGVGCPVIITEQCNLPDVRRFGTGWVVPANAEEITHALNECLRNSREANGRIGECGRELVQRKYGWRSVARQMSEVYRWVQHGEMPRSVEILRP
jgi:glycosyltransferase involved in cell wall biosynthesis